MGRYRVTMREPVKKDKKTLPIWRGIGCLIIIIVPILSYAAASLSFPLLYNQGLIPSELMIIPVVPDWLQISPPLVGAFRFLFYREGILATLTLTIVFIIIIGGFFSVLYAFMYRMVAPPRYGPLDAPPPKIKVKKYKR